MLRRSLVATSIIRSFRRYRQQARHHAIVKRHKLTYYAAEDKTRAEIRARDLLRRVESVTPWVPRPLFPVGGAAGALLMYRVLRGLRELPVSSVLELGAGQTTLLLDLVQTKW